MAKRKHKDPLLEALREGRSHTWTVPDGGDLASMRAAIKHGQTITMSPVVDPREIQIGDLVLVRWHKSDIFHIVGEIQDGRFLIVNSLGKVNGWVSRSELLGRVTKVVDPEPRPAVPVMLERLRMAYQRLIDHAQSADDARRLLTVIDDLSWYADRLSGERLDKMPRSNKWSFAQNLWRLVKQAEDAATSASAKSAQVQIDLGKACVGLAAEIVMLFEVSEA